MRNIQGLWDAIQSNRFVATVNIDPVKPDGSFTLQAEHSQGSVRGPGSGHMHDNELHFTVNWNNGTQGAYVGAFDAQGIIQGTTFDIKHPENFARWHSSRSF